MIKDIRDILAGSRLFAGFSQKELEIILINFKPVVKCIDKNQIIVRQDDNVDFVGILSSGLLSSSKIDRDGNTSLIYYIEPPKVFGLEIAATPSQKSPVTITCLEEAAVVLLPYSKFTSDELIPYILKIKLMRNICELLSNENMRKMYKIELLCQKSIRGRIWTYLDFMAQKCGNNEFEIPFDREHLAQYLNVNRSSLSNELSKMSEEGLIEFHKNRFTIK